MLTAAPNSATRSFPAPTAVKRKEICRHVSGPRGALADIDLFCRTLPPPPPLQRPDHDANLLHLRLFHHFRDLYHPDPALVRIMGPSAARRISGKFRR